MDIIIGNLRYWLIFCLETQCLILFCSYFGSLMLYRNGVEPETYQRKDVFPPSNMCIAEKLWINPGGISFQDIWLFIISNSRNLIPHIVLLVSRIPDIVQKCFRTPDRATESSLCQKWPYNRHNDLCFSRILKNARQN